MGRLLRIPTRRVVLFRDKLIDIEKSARAGVEICELGSLRARYGVRIPVWLAMWLGRREQRRADAVIDASEVEIQKASGVE